MLANPYGAPVANTDKSPEGKKGKKKAKRDKGKGKAKAGPDTPEDEPVKTGRRWKAVPKPFKKAYVGFPLEVRGDEDQGEK